MKKLALFLTLFISLSLFSQEVKYDPYQMWVTDNEDLFTPEQEKELNQLITDYEQKTTCEIAILTTSDYEDFGDIGNYAITLGEKWGVGKKDIDNGLMIIISKGNDENFVASGYGLEGYLPDGKLYQLQDTFFVPYFDQGKYFEGVKLFLLACFAEVGDEYSSDDNMTKKGESYVYEVWEWFLAIPWYWKVIVGGLYILLWIISPGTAWYLTIMLLTLGRAGGSMGGGKFGGGGSRS